MLGVSGAGGLTTSMWNLIGKKRPDIGIGPTRAAIAFATGALICTAAFEAGQQIHHIFLRRKDDVQSPRPVRESLPPSLWERWRQQ